jgi:hypothetical protein
LSRGVRFAERVLHPLEIDLDGVADSISAWRPGPVAQRRVSVLAPTSMTRGPFDPDDDPLTTEPSPYVLQKDSSSIFAKSLRDGAADWVAVAVAMLLGDG